MIVRIPGMVDPHIHLRDLDWAHKATFASETAAALAGGYWAVMDMPNTPPATTTAERLHAKKARLAASARCDFGTWLGASGPTTTTDVTDAEGCSVGLKLYCDPTTGDLLVPDPASRLAHLRAWGRASRRPVAVHAEGPTLEEVI